MYGIYVQAATVSRCTKDKWVGIEGGIADQLYINKDTASQAV
jgi:uncharacterized membrane protein YcgQ (UPF0703/DUF1980 family)